MIRIFFITSGLGVGGAEVVLLNLVKNLDRSRFKPAVVSLTGYGPLSDRLLDLGVPVYHYDLRRRPLLAFFRLTALLWTIRPDIVQTWMYHGDLIGSLASRMAGIKTIAWSLHNLELGPDARMTKLVRKICARLSRRIPRVILSCSEASAVYHVNIGYRADRIEVIPNGFDTDLFKPDADARSRVRRSLNLEPGIDVVLHVGRFDPLKNHAGFLRAVAIVAARRKNVCFLMVGKGVVPENSALSGQIRELGLEGCVHLLGPRSDMHMLLAAGDVLVQTSTSEAFPMALGEAMSCAVTCVATDVGDSSVIVGDTGCVVPVNNDALTAAGIEDLLSLPIDDRLVFGAAARQRVVTCFDIRQVTRRYESAYLGIA